MTDNEITAELENNNELLRLSTEINTIKRQTATTIIQASIEIGGRLVQAKKLVGHGNWENWLSANVDYSQRTASNLIRIFEEYDTSEGKLFGKDTTEVFAKLTTTQAIALLGIKDPDERAEFAENNDLSNMSTRELQEKIRALNAEKEKAESARDEVGKIMSEELEKEKAAKKDLKEKLADVAAKADYAIEDKKQAEEELRQARDKESELRRQINRLNEELQQRNIFDEQENARRDEEAKAQIESLNDELTKAQERIKELLNAPIETATMEVVPQEVKDEIEKLKKELEEERNKPTKAAEQTVKELRATEILKGIQEQFNSFLNIVDNREFDAEKKEKYLTVAKKLNDTMGQRICALLM